MVSQSSIGSRRDPRSFLGTALRFAPQRGGAGQVPQSVSPTLGSDPPSAKAAGSGPHPEL